jgi:hypothetical protein
MTLYIEQHKAAFAKAIANPENINEDGSINWNFVDSDIWLDSDEQGWEPSSDYIDQMFNEYQAQ